MCEPKQVFQKLNQVLFSELSHVEQRNLKDVSRWHCHYEGGQDIGVDSDSMRGFFHEGLKRRHL